jgi:hypothetical protein
MVASNVCCEVWLLNEKLSLLGVSTRKSYAAERLEVP